MAKFFVQHTYMSNSDTINCWFFITVLLMDMENIIQECKTPLLPGKYQGKIQLKIPELPNVMSK